MSFLLFASENLLIRCLRGQFTAPDLATIAHELDALEQGTLDAHSRHSTSMNMDDTGAIRYIESDIANH